MLDMEMLTNMKNYDRSYSELVKLPRFIDRYRYLKLNGTIGDKTFGYDRYLNQILYQSSEWRRFRRNIVIRDNGCDLATPGHEIQGKILIHHINPITLRDIEQRDPKVFDPENVISTSLLTHNAIHYGDESILITEPIERRPNDTCPWKC